MILYKTQICACSPFSSPLQSDTFFGAFCWSYRYLHGEKALFQLLKDCREGHPPIIFSNAFPEGYLPLPAGARDHATKLHTAADKKEREKAYQQNKKDKKCNLITIDAFLHIQNGSRDGYSPYLAKESAEVVEMMHNMVLRNSGTVTDTPEGGNLFSKMQYFTDHGIYDLYILTSMEKEELMPVLKQMLELGIGGQKSTGKGHFKLKNKCLEDCTDLTKVTNANAYVALSNFIPAKTDPVDGFYQTMVKYGKLDREYASGETPFKKPLLYLLSGAVFYAKPVKQWYGRCLSDVAVNPDVIINACTIALPMKMKR